MSEEEQNKVKDLLDKWKEEASHIKKSTKQKKGYAVLDNGNSGEFTKLTQKYQKLIEERLKRKIWNK